MDKKHCAELDKTLINTDTGDIGKLFEQFMRLLAAGNTGGPDDWMPLHYAAYRGDAAFMQFLVENRADMNAEDNFGRTPLYFAVRRGYADCARILIEAGANVNAANRYGETPLYCAAVNGNTACMSMLIEAGAHIDTRTGNGTTPLHRAAGQNRIDCMRILIGSGADPEIRNKDNETVWNILENNYPNTYTEHIKELKGLFSHVRQHRDKSRPETACADTGSCMPRR